MVKRKKVRRSKKHSRTSPQKQFKELKEKRRRTLPDHQINWTVPARTQKSSIKIEKLKNQNWTKLYSLLKLLKLLKLRQNFFPIKIPISKHVENQFLFLKSVQYYIGKTWKIFIGPWRTINSKMNKEFRKKRNQLQIIRNYCWKSWYKYLQYHFFVSRGYPANQFHALKNSLAHRSIGKNF